jgi:hypothetical protein
MRQKCFERSVTRVSCLKLNFFGSGPTWCPNCTVTDRSLSMSIPPLSLDARRILSRVPPELTREQAKILASVRKRAEEYLNRSHTRDQAGKDGLLKQLDRVIGFLKPAVDAFPETKAMEKYRDLVLAVEIREARPETERPGRRMRVLSGGLPGQGKRG